jgi:hypothetical protein
MDHMREPISVEIERYLRTGDADPLYRAWPGDIIERGQRACRELREALGSDVKRLAGGRTHASMPTGDMVALTRRKVTPMVNGFFPRTERDAVLAVLERSVLFVTSDNINAIILEHDSISTVWTVANLYLESLGGPLLGDEAEPIVGLNEHMTSYVSPAYFHEDNLFADFIVHEAAHVFHNCKRRTIGLPEKRRREWLLDIAFGKRETFAYSCEAYSRILECADGPADRRRLADEFAANVRISDVHADSAEVASIVRDAASMRNGWRVILARCAPARPKGRETTTYHLEPAAIPLPST